MNWVESVSKYFLRLWLGLLCAFFLGGCSASLSDRGDDWMASYPAPQERSAVPTSGSIYQAATALALFEDRRARRVGDTLTIHLIERMDAAKTSSTSTSKATESNISPPTVFGRGVTHQGINILDTNLAASRGFDGEGESTQSNRLEGSVTVTVAQVLPNGSLLVRGQKRLLLNQGEEYVRVRGLVRPEDIAPDNSVQSSRLADASIEYSGKGALADANAMGWFGRFIQSLISPF